MTLRQPPVSNQGISVAALMADPALAFSVRLIAGESGTARQISHPRIQKSGLVMVGHTHGVVASRLQVIGETELGFVAQLDEEARAVAARALFSLQLACVLVTCGATPPAVFLEEAERTQTPLLVCDERSSTAITLLHALLDERLAPRTRIHGVLVDVFEVGVLLLGRSGVGKSEAALELVMRGHRLVADDVVECDYRPPGMVFAEPAELLRHHIEVRGLGILDIKDLYGVTAIRERKRIDLVVRLELTDQDTRERIGIEDHTYEVLGVPIREVLIPVRPGRSASAIIEIAARQELLRQAGHDASRSFAERVDARAMPQADGRSLVPQRLSPRDAVAATRAGPLESSVPPPIQEKNRR